MLENVFLNLIRIYQKLTVNKKPCCRFIPSCSEYARKAIIKHGTMRGGWLILKRIFRCRPLGRFGYDPVP